VEPSDEALCERVAKRDEAAFDLLVARYQERAYRLAWSMLRNAEDARDLSQEAFIRLYEAAGSFRGRSKFSTWFYRILVNLCLDHKRKHRWWKLWARDEGDDGTDPILERQPAPARDPVGELSREQTMKDLELWESRDKMFMHLSGGQAKRLETAKVLIQRPKVAIFDEPTSQVDLRGKRKIWDKIKALRNEGSTVIVATNEVREAEYLADRVTILHKGTKVVCDSISVLKDAIAGGDVVEVGFEDPVSGGLVESLKELGGSLQLSPEGNQLRARVSRAEDWVPKMTSASYEQGARISSIRVTEPSLDDVFLHFTGTALEEKQ